jgi:hypothetical protein
MGVQTNPNLIIFVNRMNSGSPIRHKLDTFIRSYYQQKVVQGLVYTALQTLIVFYLVNYTEYMMWLSSPTRGVLFYGFCVLMVVLLFLQVLHPLGKLYHSAAREMSYEKAAWIIGKHFPEISDKLLNLLQLEEMGKGSESPLLLKSIAQKTLWLKPFAFVDALNWPEFKKSMYRFTGILFLLVLWGFYDVSSISAASQRIFNYQQQYKRPAPFTFIHEPFGTPIPEGQDVMVVVQFEGTTIPEEVSLKMGNQKMVMKPDGRKKFVFPLKQIKESIAYSFEALEFESEPYELKVWPKFEFQSIKAKAIYPAYTLKNAEYVSLTQDMMVPEGTKIAWEVTSNKANVLEILEPNGTTKKISSSAGGTFQWVSSYGTPGFLKMWSKGEGMSSDTFTKRVEVIFDDVPQIQLEEQQELLGDQNAVVVGHAMDDYGISKVFIEYQRITTKEPSGQSKMERISLPFKPAKAVVIAHQWDLKNMGLLANEGLKFRVGVTDNDASKGGKTVYTDWKTLKRLSENEIEKQVNAGKDQIEKQLSDAQSQSKQLQRQSEKLKQSMSSSPQLGFEMQEKVSDWLEKQQEQLKKLAEIQKQQERIDSKQKEISPENKELKERRKDLDDRLKRMEDPKLQELMKELQELLERKRSPQEIQQKMDQIDRRMQHQKDEMEQLLEQLKELRLEEQIDFQNQKMQEWIEKQGQLEKQTQALEKQEKNPATKQEMLQKLMEELKLQEEKAKEIKSRAQEIESQNKKLETPMKLDLGQKEIDQAEQQQKQASEELKNQKESKSQEKQKQAAQEMQKAQEKMQQSLQKAQQERNSEDLQALRALLENLIEVSHKQEKVFLELSRLQGENPRVKALNQEQMNIKNMSQGIEDSLKALAKRQPMVSDLVTREIAEINDHMERAFEGLKVRDVRRASIYEQYVMTGYNNLGVMLMESLKNVQQRMNQSSSSSPSGKMCQNPKPGNSGKSQQGKGSKLSEQQQKLGEKLQKLQQEGQQGKEGKPQSGEKDGKEGKGQKQGKEGKEGKEGQEGESGTPKSGDKGKTGEGNGQSDRLTDKDWVEMMLMQEELRRKIETLRKESLKEGKTGQAANLFEVEKLMDEQEKKWAQKKLDNQMMWRQKQIETRLLEHEKAQMQQDQDENRQSKTGTVTDWVIPPDWIEKQRKKIQEQEQLQRANPQWQPYFQKKSEEYMRQK